MKNECSNKWEHENMNNILRILSNWEEQHEWNEWCSEWNVWNNSTE